CQPDFCGFFGESLQTGQNGVPGPEDEQGGEYQHHNDLPDHPGGEQDFCRQQAIPFPALKTVDKFLVHSPSGLPLAADEQQQSQYIRMFNEQGIDAVILTHNIDQPFISQLEQNNDKIRFQRIDADLTDTFKEEVGEGETEALKQETDTLTELFRKVLGKEKLEVKVEKLKDAGISAMVTLSEESRRMQDMMKMYNMYGMDPTMFAGEETLILNANNALVKYVFEHGDGEHVPMFCEQLYDLALISHKPLAPEAMSKFIARSNEIMLLLAK
nr:hypothetical protein [Lachnospiraceae bacterium]